ncbi:PQQ-binding-like beta-propeller repeat protein [Algoriphagus halophilus]|uniref:PQQ-binding-like beta-propeller repeat protein n=1 Tax=Algoriphagus halophilus TaxID=226505 RepID=UPI00358F8920
MKISYFLLALCIFFLVGCEGAKEEIDYTDWSHYGGPEDGSRYSSLQQINKSNVAQLSIAWTYQTGDATERSQIQCQPIVVDGLLFGTTPKLNVFALDAETGKEVWRFDPFQVLPGEKIPGQAPIGELVIGRQERIKEFFWSRELVDGSECVNGTAYS